MDALLPWTKFLQNSDLNIDVMNLLKICEPLSDSGMQQDPLKNG